LVRVADEQLALATEGGLEHFRAWALVHRGWLGEHYAAVFFFQSVPPAASLLAGQ
jgi:hypothetical protein